MAKEGRPEPADEGREDPKAKVEGWAKDFKAIMEKGSEAERFDYLQQTLVMLMHKVHTLEKNFDSANRHIEQLDEKVRNLEEDQPA